MTAGQSPFPAAALWRLVANSSQRAALTSAMLTCTKSLLSPDILLVLASHEEHLNLVSHA